ncbi:hypothetical protein PCH_Pc22g23530 [Penicillium rubens Wisconsin 54-1255]|uniref:Uncharacterized protein n=1 Tax=Penicillium rubens (strain ATCC 28089 / DSM 1075 / NRRL 1951 / Wisconsin 54-1255) TaxID=500485 RepID=B6HVU0_PENRW|nr:hypothetical protein PCH_Pc22g23530 [Penicillium rubens Wisconsin 54-1255]
MWYMRSSTELHILQSFAFVIRQRGPVPKEPPSRLVQTVDKAGLSQNVLLNTDEMSGRNVQFSLDRWGCIVRQSAIRGMCIVHRPLLEHPTERNIVPATDYEYTAVDKTGGKG